MTSRKEEEITTLVTLDTNICPADEIIKTANELNMDFAIVTVTEREIGGSDIKINIEPIKKIKETGVYGESKYGTSVYGPTTIPESFILDESMLDEGVLFDDKDADVFETALQIISSNSFPPDGKRDNLTKKQTRQLRDAMIICAHAREGRNIFVTDDKKGFINHGRRQKLERTFNTKIMTRQEFIEYCRKRHKNVSGDSRGQSCSN